MAGGNFTQACGSKGIIRHTVWNPVLLWTWHMMKRDYFRGHGKLLLLPSRYWLGSQHSQVHPKCQLYPLTLTFPATQGTGSWLHSSLTGLCLMNNSAKTPSLLLGYSCSWWCQRRWHHPCKNGSGLSPFPLQQLRNYYFKLHSVQNQLWRMRNIPKLPLPILHGAPLCFPPVLAIDAGG